MVRDAAPPTTPPTSGRSPPGAAAELAAAGVHDAVPLRQCTHRLSLRTATPACALAELGRCPAPCEHRITPEEYDAQRRRAVPHRDRRRPAAGGATRCWPGSTRSPATSATRRRPWSRSRLAALLRATVRMQRLAALTRLAELVAARPAAGGGWEIGVVRHGRLAGAGDVPAAARIRGRRSTRSGPPPRRCRPRARAGAGATAEETERILAWLERPETRLVEMPGGWASPARGAARFRDLLAKAEGGRGPTDSRPNAHEQLTDRTTLDSLRLLEKCSPARFVGLLPVAGVPATAEPG